MTRWQWSRRTGAGALPSRRMCTALWKDGAHICIPAPTHYPPCPGTIEEKVYQRQLSKEGLQQVG